MIDVIPAKPWMARKLQLQTVQILNGATMTPDAIDMALEGGMALAATDGTRLLGMAGIYERWDDVGLAWALLAEDFADHKVSVFKLMISTALRIRRCCGFSGWISKYCAMDFYLNALVKDFF